MKFQYIYIYIQYRYVCRNILINIYMFEGFKRYFQLYLVMSPPPENHQWRTAVCFCQQTTYSAPCIKSLPDLLHLFLFLLESTSGPLYTYMQVFPIFPFFIVGNPRWVSLLFSSVREAMPTVGFRRCLFLRHVYPIIIYSLFQPYIAADVFLWQNRVWKRIVLVAFKGLVP